MKELERRALMGDKEAQKLCTEQGIVLPCPCCGGNAKVRYTGINSGPDGYTSNVYARSKQGLVKCDKCGLKTSRYMRLCRALARWNTRPAPPVGSCKDCKHLGERVVHETGKKENFCNHEQYGMFAFDSTEAYCSYFDPKEEGNT